MMMMSRCKTKNKRTHKRTPWTTMMMEMTRVAQHTPLRTYHLNGAIRMQVVIS